MSSDFCVESEEMLTLTNKTPKYINNIFSVDELSESEQSQLFEVTRRFRFHTNDYYLSLIDWDDPDDPIRRIIVPDLDELDEWGDLDPSNEKDYTVLPGLEHKYPSTALLLASKACGGICRYCFRKRVFIQGHDETLKDLNRAIQYINRHEEITNVLITGGDSLALPTSRLENIIHQLTHIQHLRIIRLGTKMVAFNPYRIVDDLNLMDLIFECCHSGKQVYIMTHFTHPREVTDIAIKAVLSLQQAGAIICNQTPIINGVNHDPNVLAELFQNLTAIGVAPYYIFQCRPSRGNRSYAVPVEEGYQIFEKAKSFVSGLAKRARFVMSHQSGKIEIVGLSEENIYLKYHRAYRQSDSGKFMVMKRNPQAFWLDDYDDAMASQPL